jgi:hypothetical protein
MMRSSKKEDNIKNEKDANKTIENSSTLESNNKLSNSQKKDSNELSSKIKPIDNQNLNPDNLLNKGNVYFGKKRVFCLVPQKKSHIPQQKKIHFLI